MIEINFIVGSLVIGGTERHLSQVLPSLKEMGFSPKVILLSNKASLKPNFEKAGIPVILGPNFTHLPKIIRRPISLITSVCRLMFYFLSNRTAIYHVFLPEAYLLTALAARLTFFKGLLVMSRRSLNNYRQRQPALQLERLFYRFTTMALGNSKAVVQQLYDEGFEHGKVSLIYNGIDLSPFQNLPTKREQRENFNFDQSALIFIIVANLIPYKGHLDLLDALSIIHSKLPKPWKLICVGGDGGILDQLKKHAEGLGIDKNVEFLGSRSDTNLLLNAADIGILCSHEEGFSNAILEGMAAGLPMVVTRVGGNAEAVLDMETGFVVEPKNPDSLAEALLSLALASDLRVKFGQTGKDRVQQHFSLQQCVNQYALFYSKLLRQFER